MKLDLKNKKVLVMGLGLHGGGVGVAGWLATQGAKVTVTDLKTKQQLAKSLAELKGLPIKYVLGRHRREDFTKIDLLIKNPGVPDNSPFLQLAIKIGVPVESDISLFFLQCAAPVLGITGTKGKSTTTTLVGEIFKIAKRRPVVAGNIRVSPLKFLKQIKKDSSVILELSSWQLESLAKHQMSPRWSVITNLSPDHLNRYANYQAYIEAKTLIFKFQTPGDVCLLNRDNAICRRLGKIVPGERYWFSKKYFGAENGSYVKSGVIYFRSPGREIKVLPVASIKLLGEHNLENVLAATAISLSAGAPLTAVRSAVKNFKGLPDRLELVSEYAGVKYYNDTTATAPAAAIQSLKTLSNGKKRIILLAGGADKNLVFGDLAREIKKSAKAVVLFPGTATPKLKKELLKLNYWAITEASGMTEAVGFAKKLARAGEIVLLSPGCASFGLFINEFDRGEQFREQVKKLGKSPKSQV